VGRFILSPALHPSDDPTTATPVLIAATRCYHALTAHNLGRLDAKGREPCPEQLETLESGLLECVFYADARGVLTA
jgi:hypothetical protein